MAQFKIQTLMAEIREQLNRNGLAEDSRWYQNPPSKLDIERIRLTIQREEKLYPLALNA